ncbi:Rpn family recombination-promoting nuclease/putative transposase [Wujia sp.]|uniref:Rpn family recombination-promoting nuclease/putative transposase n=1 Tax=Wujia sp. TaxID=2944172 RepID=UPI003F81C1E7
MGKLDDMAKELYEDNLVFADTMNVLFFDGKPMIRAQDLSPLDPTEEHTIFDDDFVIKTESKEKTDKTQNKAEAFSNQKYRDVTFTPVLTVVVYLGKETWDAPETLHDMLDLEGVPDILRERIPNYQITLLQPGSVTSEQLARMKSPLLHILGVIKASTNWQDMNNYVNQNKKDLSHLDSLTAGIISEACNMNIPKQEPEKEDVRQTEHPPFIYMIYPD